MKYILFIITLSFFVPTAEAQLFTKERLQNFGNAGKGDYDQRTLTWGYFLGFNSFDFKIEYNEQFDDENTDILIDEEVGFNVGLIGDMRLGKYVNLRLEPGLYYGRRDLYFPGFTEEKDFLREIKSTYIHVPLLLKLSTARLNNFKPFIVGGISTSFNLSSNEKNPEDNFEGRFRTKAGNTFFEIGFGIDFYLYYFKFTPSIRGVFGTSNELVRDDDPDSPWTGNIDNLYTRAILINFTFQ